MRTIIDKLEDYTKDTPNTAILFDETHTKGITYAQFDEMTGRVYGYLKKNGIGKDICPDQSSPWYHAHCGYGRCVEGRCSLGIG